eukprot:TRINITY_DN1790_c0_g1_i1.p1 TRINITY_DN1790_c0_g1~~TRINITY_DN1790_c0_g1_i1.p1  ORF type:complete len:183 (-),score=12.43 TRINITY_DN1790_c0_g1_i1:152-700(-)
MMTEVGEDSGTLQRPIPRLRKNIRKFKSARKQSACSNRTLPDTLTKSIPSKEVTPPNSPSTVSMQQTQKPPIIPSLKALLAVPSPPLFQPSITEPPLCTYIKLKSQKTRKLEGFKLFREDEFPLFSQRMTKVTLNEPGYDNDDNTDNEQIRNGIRVMETNIVEGLRDKGKDIANLSRFKICA